MSALFYFQCLFSHRMCLFPHFWSLQTAVIKYQSVFVCGDFRNQFWQLNILHFMFCSVLRNFNFIACFEQNSGEYGIIGNREIICCAGYHYGVYFSRWVKLHWKKNILQKSLQNTIHLFARLLEKKLLKLFICHFSSAASECVSKLQAINKFKWAPKWNVFSICARVDKNAKDLEDAVFYSKWLNYCENIINLLNLSIVDWTNGTMSWFELD